jgi:hypothetical protein
MRSKDLFPEGWMRQKLRQFRFKGNFHDMDGVLNIFDDPPEYKSPTEGRDYLAPENHSVALEVQRLLKEERVF